VQHRVTGQRRREARCRGERGLSGGGRRVGQAAGAEIVGVAGALRIARVPVGERAGPLRRLLGARGVVEALAAVTVEEDRHRRREGGQRDRATADRQHRAAAAAHDAVQRRPAALVALAALARARGVSTAARRMKIDHPD
jgi:hypothetical protein